jgi:hypothetical protein
MTGARDASRLESHWQVCFLILFYFLFYIYFTKDCLQPLPTTTTTTITITTTTSTCQRVENKSNDHQNGSSRRGSRRVASRALCGFFFFISFINYVYDTIEYKYIIYVALLNFVCLFKKMKKKKKHQFRL